MRRGERGDTIIEVLFSMTIIGVVLAAAYGVASKNLQVSQLAKERTQATELAISQLDQLKALEVEPTAPPSGAFCIDLTDDSPIKAADDPACAIDPYQLRITKNGANYIVAVEWIPPGGNSENLAEVRFVYSDYDFSLVGNANLALFRVSSSGTSAILGARILNDTAAVRRGIVYGTTPNPQVGDGVSVTGLDNGSGRDFQTTISGLDPAVTYYARMFIETAQDGYQYSNVITLNNTGVSSEAPLVTTGGASAQTPSTTEVSGRVLSDNGFAVTSRGVVYGTTANPTTSSTRVDAAQAGTGDFTVVVSGLQPATTYYARAYAINEKGTSYGDQISFTTTTPPANLVDAGTLNGKRYYLSNDAVTWVQAQAAARAAGGNLVTINSAEENTFVANFLNGPDIWIGLNDRQTEGTWVWESGQVTTFAFPWNNPPQPDDWRGLDTVNGEDAVMMYTSGSLKGRWNDLSDTLDVRRYAIEFN